MRPSNTWINWLAFLKSIAARYGDTPSGFTGDVVKATQEIIKGEHTPYRASIPSQRTYIFGEKNFPISTHQPVFNPKLQQYDVNFGVDTFYVPRRDSAKLIQNLNNRVVKWQEEGIVLFPNAFIEFSSYRKRPKNYYDAGRHSITPKIDKDGKVVVLLDDVYDFEGEPENYTQVYTDVESSQSPGWLRNAAVKAMLLIGTPYEVHQTVPIKFTGNYTPLPSNVEDFDRTMLNNILKAFNKLFKKPLDQLTAEEVSAALTNRNLPGDKLIKEWESKGLLKKQGGTINIKKKNKGKFTDYCGGKVTEECIRKGKNSSNPTTRKRANFAANARKWKHEEGGVINYLNYFR